MIHQIKAWFEAGVIDLFLGYRERDHHPLPHCFTEERLEELNELVISSVRYPLEKIAVHLARVQPDIKIGMLAHDCQERALNVLVLWNQLNRENITTLKLNCCPSPLKNHADCSYLEHHPVGSFKQQVGIDNRATREKMDAFGAGERLDRWMYEFQKCIKCYGCRDICPVCFCTECSLEHDDLVRTGPLLPEVPVFHLVRAVHMAGRCVDCGLCEAACPMDIPLRLLYENTNRIVMELFDYQAGSSDERSPFNILGDTVTLEPRPIVQAQNDLPWEHIEK